VLNPPERTTLPSLFCVVYEDGTCTVDRGRWRSLELFQLVDGERRPRVRRGLMVLDEDWYFRAFMCAEVADVVHPS